MPSSVSSTAVSWTGLLTSQSFCGASRIRAPLTPPRLSLPRKEEAAAQVVDTSWPVLNPDSRTCCLSVAASASSISSWSTAGSGSCQSSSSAGTSGPR